MRAAGKIGVEICVLGAAALLPRGSGAQYVVGGSGLALAAGAYFALPVWQILLSRQMAARPAVTADWSEVAA